jgi:hypothetical protein
MQNPTETDAVAAVAEAAFGAPAERPAPQTLAETILAVGEWLASLPGLPALYVSFHDSAYYTAFDLVNVQLPPYSGGVGQRVEAARELAATLADRGEAQVDNTTISWTGRLRGVRIKIYTSLLDDDAAEQVAE